MPIIKFENVGSVGWIADVPAHDLPENPISWSSATNFIFRAATAERSTGYAAGFDTTPTQASYGLFGATKVNGDTYLIGAGTSKVFDYRGTTENEITGTTTPAATADTKWTGGVITGFLVVNDSVGTPQYIAVESLGGATNLADLTNWPASTTAKVLRPWKFYLVAGDMTESGTRYPYKVRWSNSAEPGTLPTEWTATTSNDAGSVDLSADDGRIVDMIPLGDQMAIYKEYGIVMMRHVGGVDTVNRLVFYFNRASVGTSGGMMANNCGCDVSGIGHVVLSYNDVYVFDGSKIYSVLDKRLRRQLFGSINTSKRGRSFVVNNAIESEVWVCVPTGSSESCDTAFVWNYADNTTGMRSMPNATAGAHLLVAEAAGVPVVGPGLDLGVNNRKTVISSADNKIYVFGNAKDANGSTFTSNLQRDYLSLGDDQRVKLVRAIWPEFYANAGQVITIQVGTSMSMAESISWQAAQNFTVGTTRKLDINKAGRYISVKFGSTTGEPWRLKSFDIDVTPQGLW